LEGERKSSVEDFDKLLGSIAYTEPTVTEEAIKLLVAVSKVAEKLAGDHPCIASMGYKYAAELMHFHSRSIAENMSCKDRFLVRVFHKIDTGSQIAFGSIYDQVCHPQTAAFIINLSIIATLYKELDIMFKQIVRN